MNKNKDHNELLNLLVFLSEDDSKDINEVKEELSLAGIQPALLLKESDDLIKNLIGKRRRELAKIKLSQMKEKLYTFMQTSKEVTGASAKEFLLSLLGNKNSETFQASFRKIESLNDKDALDILDENKLLEFFSQFMDEEK